MGKPVIDTHRGDSVFRRDRAGKVLAYRGGAAGDAAGANSSNARTSGRGRELLNAVPNNNGVNVIHRCKECKRSFRNKCNFEVHMRTHTGEKPYQCLACKKAFAQLSTLQRHKRLHFGDRPYRCSICNASYVQAASLDAHLRSKSHRNSQQYRCIGCGKGFNQLGNLKMHYVGMHTNQRPYICSVCNKDFVHRGELIKHGIKKHSKEEREDMMKQPHNCFRGYPCHKCNTTLSSLIQFYNHFLKSCPAAPMIAIDAYTDDTTSGKAPAANAIVVSSGGWVGIGSKTRSSSSSTSSSSCNGRRRRGTRSRSCSVFSSSFYGGGRGQDRIISSSSSSRKRQETTL